MGEGAILVRSAKMGIRSHFLLDLVHAWTKWFFSFSWFFHNIVILALNVGAILLVASIKRCSLNYGTNSNVHSFQRTVYSFSIPIHVASDVQISATQSLLEEKMCSALSLRLSNDFRYYLNLYVRSLVQHSKTFAFIHFQEK